MRLEVLSRRPDRPADKPPLLFIHGAYVGAWCWEEFFLGWFAARGYEVHAVSLRGHGASEGREGLDAFGLADYAEDVAGVMGRLDSPPVVVGHSMGALVAQKALERGAVARAQVLACPVPSFGLLPSSFALAWTRPSLFASLHAVAGGGRASPEALAEVLFATPPDAALASRCYRRMQRESKRALMDMAGWGLPAVWGTRRPRTLVLGASRDALIPAMQVRATAGMLSAEYRELEGLGHAVMLDAGWEAAALAIAGWIAEKAA